jgi:serine/threonine protein kinase
MSHPDNKPENVLLADFGHNIYAPGSKNITVKVCDFGLSKSADTAMTGAIGTPPYMAPEVCRTTDEKMYDPFKVDVWAFGVLLHYVDTRKVPYDGIRAFEIWERVAKREGMLDPSECSLPELALMLADCWKRDPMERPTMAEIIKRLPEEVCPVRV